MLDELKKQIAKYGALIIFLLILTGVGILVLNKNRISILKNMIKIEKEENVRIQNNYDASLDTITVYRDKNGNLTSQITAYRLKNEELSKNYKNLFSLYTKEKNKEPIVIVEYRTKIDEKITNISTIVSDTSIYFIDSVKYSDGSYRSIEANIPYKITYHIKKDMVNRFAFEKALYYAYFLEESGVQNPKVVAFKNNEIIPIREALKEDPDNLIFRIKIMESENKIPIIQLVRNYELSEESITQKYENDKYVYYVGNVIPYSNIEPIVEEDEISTFANIFAKQADINLKQGISVYTGLVKDEKTGKVLIDVKSDYPGLTFSNIVGADILQDPVSRKVAREFRKEFGIGLNAGYGIMLVPEGDGYLIKKGPEISVGVNWTPRFFQW